MKRVIDKFIDMLFYSKMFKVARGYHYHMAYEQGKFDYRMNQLNGSELMEGTYEN